MIWLEIPLKMANLKGLNGFKVEYKTKLLAIQGGTDDKSLQIAVPFLKRLLPKCPCK